VASKAEKYTDIGLLVLRVGLGTVLLYYGLQKAFGAFGGSGFQAQLQLWETTRGIPKWLGSMAIIAEFAGSMGVIFGLFTRVAAFGMMCTMATAVFFGFSRPGSFSALTSGDRAIPAMTLFPLALAFAAAALIFTGAGAFSLDAKVFKRGR
jgi:putative oxidoreductase